MTRALAIALGAAAVAASWSRQAATVAERAAPPDGRFIDLAPARLHVWEHGSGPAVLMIHGVSGQIANFQDGLAEALVGAGHRVVLVDRPGYGYSTAPHHLGIAEQARLMAALIARLGLARPLVVGHSFGAAVAMALALDQPAAIGGVALLAPLIFAPPRPPAWLRGVVGGAVSRALLAHVVGPPVLRLTRQAVVRRVFAPEPVAPAFFARGGARLSTRPGSIDQALFEATRAIDGLPALAARYPALHVPVAMLAAQSDHVVDSRAQAAALRCALPQALVEWAEGGHMLPLTQPARCAEFLREMARRLA